MLQAPIFFKTLCLFFLLFCTVLARAQSKAPALYQLDKNAETRWSSFENIKAEKGKGGQENNGAKGHPFERILPGEKKVLLDAKGPGIVNRIWLTVNERSPQMLRALTIEMFWDGETKPAVSAPLGDFFGSGLSIATPFENAFFAQPEGRSFVCTIPMPFKKSARIVVTNEGRTPLGNLFFDVNFQLLKIWQPENLYFHAYFNRDTATALAHDFVLLPKITGAGRFLGAVFGVITNPVYTDTWWGEGEVKMFLDGDANYATLVGTGTEDYIGTGWGQGKFVNANSGCTVADTKGGQWAFYRFHVPDPIFFKSACAITLQQIGGGPKALVAQLQKNGVPLLPVTIDATEGFKQLYKKDSVLQLTNPALPDGWVNFYRSDDVSAVAYFYLDKPVSSLPQLVPLGVRLAKTEKPASEK